MRQIDRLKNEHINVALPTMASVRSHLINSVWMLQCFISAMTETCTDFNQTETIRHQPIYQGQSTTINCHYTKNRTQQLTVSLTTQHRWCEYQYMNTFWNKNFCDDSITFIWHPETDEISFQLLNLQINHSGLYTSTVVRYFPPPTRCLEIKRMFIHVKAPPSVSVSCVKGHGGVPRVFCSAESFYPADLNQAWLRDGEYISYLNNSFASLYQENLNSSDVTWNYSKNTDSTYSVTSYLPLSSRIAVYYCWVNHSTLSQPITISISSTECIEREEALTGVYLSVTAIGCGVMACIGLVIVGRYQCHRKRTYFQSPVEAAPFSGPVYHSTPGTLEIPQPIPRVYSTLMKHQSFTQVYSTLGNHQPVPCRSNSSDTSFPE